jgi:hypothetical protein
MPLPNVGAPSLNDSILPPSSKPHWVNMACGAPTVIINIIEEVIYDNHWGVGNRLTVRHST